MSAWIVSERHITTLITAAWEMLERDLSKSTRMGRILWQTNHDSVNARYRSKDECPSYRYDPCAVVPRDPVVILKAIACYEYQSCEHDGWEDSEARKFCERLRDVTIHRLPGFDEAPWGIE